TPPGWREAYTTWSEAGWCSLTGDPAFGGQGLPMALQIALTDIWNQANPAFALNPLLTIGAVEALQAHGTPEQQALYLPKMITGEWAGTMNLTEPHAGSDLGDLKTRAEPQGDGTYRLFGQKIYISYGEHDLTENIIHLVLARLPDAPAGTRGISLFLVPKRHVAADGTLGAVNDIHCAGLERKLGLHASPTCTLIYGAAGEGALGTMVGAPHRGLSALFTMMNNARVSVGMQGAAIAERATQAAIHYAAERRQGRTKGAADMVPIKDHADVKRMLLTMRGLTSAARAICYACAVAIDRGRDDPFYAARADLLTPIAKAFATDAGVEVASIGIQVHGGMGYIEETGAAQYLRDARIFPIYEGTNGIQALDLLRRKITMEDGAVLTAFLAELQETADRARTANTLALQRAAQHLAAAIAAVADAAATLRARLDEAPERALPAATPFLQNLGTTAGGAYLIKGALESTNGQGPTREAVAQVFAATQLVPVPAALSGALESADHIAAYQS
ncbi:MAG: acyl-CoA dehydrogenase family protein, partial [Pseudomonadota bacterium]